MLPFVFTLVAWQRNPLSALATAIAVAQSQSLEQISFSIAFLGITLGATLSPFTWSILLNSQMFGIQSYSLIAFDLRNPQLEVGSPHLARLTLYSLTYLSFFSFLSSILELINFLFWC